MTNVGRTVIEETRAALERYKIVVEGSGLQPTTKKNYIIQATNFLRWMEGEFVPGLRTDTYQSRGARAIHGTPDKR